MVITKTTTEKYLMIEASKNGKFPEDIVKSKARAKMVRNMILILQ